MAAPSTLTRPTAHQQWPVGRLIDRVAARRDALVRPPRIVGLDVARAVAILGMVGAHVATLTPEAELSWSRPASWDALASGRPSLLFALVAGVSLALVSGGTAPPTDPDALRRLRLRLVGRGVAVFVIGIGAELLATQVAVILGLYGVVFVLAPLIVTWSPTRLLVAAGGLAAVGPVALGVVQLLSLRADGAAIGLSLGYFPLTVWFVPVLIGLALGRCGVHRDAVLRRAGAGGAVLLGLGLALTRWAPAATLPAPGSGPTATWADRLRALHAESPLLRQWWESTPHSGGFPEVAAGTGLALLVVVGCVLLGRRLGAGLLPLSALGSLPLTGYVVHLVVISVAMGGPGGALRRSDLLWAQTSIGLLVGATLWALTMGSGPLERWVGRVAARFAA